MDWTQNDVARYSRKTNRFGLTVDTVVEYQLALPDGQVTVVTEKDEELWFALKGGLNNYGIVTRFTLRFHRQSDIWILPVQATLLVFAEDQIKNAHVAFAKFLTGKHDNKGAQIGQHTYANGALTVDIHHPTLLRRARASRGSPRRLVEPPK
ncbi:hypothetical protein BC826DRAFT_567845 [Russula brevipes]|nr:hypothetical protein BC826DRAFT_567845 [Russula brevipes]